MKTKQEFREFAENTKVMLDIHFKPVFTKMHDEVISDYKQHDPELMRLYGQIRAAQKELLDYLKKRLE